MNQCPASFSFVLGRRCGLGAGLLSWLGLELPDSLKLSLVGNWGKALTAVQGEPWVLHFAENIAMI